MVAETLNFHLWIHPLEITQMQDLPLFGSTHALRELCSLFRCHHHDFIAIAWVAHRWTLQITGKSCQDSATRLHCERCAFYFVVITMTAHNFDVHRCTPWFPCRSFQYSNTHFNCKRCASVIMSLSPWLDFYGFVHRGSTVVVVNEDCPYRLYVRNSKGADCKFYHVIWVSW
jgi:hypothetical protein